MFLIHYWRVVIVLYTPQRISLQRWGVFQASSIALSIPVYNNIATYNLTPSTRHIIIMNLLIRSTLLAVTVRSASAFVAPRATTSFAARAMSLNASKPFAVLVQAEIQADRMDEFVKLIEENAINTRKEPGCLRFGTLLQLYKCIL
jgi:hypothetical protein